MENAGVYHPPRQFNQVGSLRFRCAKSSRGPGGSCCGSRLSAEGGDTRPSAASRVGGWKVG